LRAKANRTDTSLRKRRRPEYEGGKVREGLPRRGEEGQYRPVVGGGQGKTVLYKGSLDTKASSKGKACPDTNRIGALGERHQNLQGFQQLTEKGALPIHSGSQKQGTRGRNLNPRQKRKKEIPGPKSRPPTQKRSKGTKELGSKKGPHKERHKRKKRWGLD